MTFTPFDERWHALNASMNAKTSRALTIERQWYKEFRLKAEGIIPSAAGDHADEFDTVAFG
jgi:hypothetical protein